MRQGLLRLLPAVLFAACARPPEAVTLRLTDLYAPAPADGAAAAPEAPPAKTELRFDAAAPAWKAGPGVASLAVKDGRLAGQTTDAFSIVDLERSSGLDDHDVVDSIEVRARVSAGEALFLSFRQSEKVDLAEALQDARIDPWRARVTLKPGPDVQTYTIPPSVFTRPPVGGEIRHVLLRPSDAKGARFEIESVRLVMRRERLAQIPAGVSWQGLSEIYRETLVARAPQRLRIPLRLPKRPLLDMGLGTIEDGPVTFTVSLGTGGREETLLERTLTTPQRWEEAPVDLGRWAEQDVTLTLGLDAPRKNALGFWGAPAVRARGAMPAPKAPAAAGGEPPQGVVLIWSDTTRRDHLSVYGYERDTTPALRKLATEGALFRDCVSQATWTKVATPSLMTSLYPLSHRVHDFSDRVPSAAVTLAEVFRDAGYATLSLSSILFTGRFTNLHQGFEQVHEDGSLPDKGSSKTARTYVDRLLPWLEAHRDVPFFVFLHVSDPHDPYRPQPPYDALWSDPAGREAHEKQLEAARKVIKEPLLKMFGMPDRAEMKQAGLDPDAYVDYDRGWYDGSILAMDVELGRLFERLKTLGLDQRTLVVYTGDHGEEFLEHGRTFHGQSTYGELSSVPLIVRMPGAVPAGQLVPDTVETVDLMPTILELARLAPPAGMQGRSLLPLLGGAAAPGTVRAAPAWRPRPAFTEKAVTQEPVGAPPPQDTASYSVVADGYKLVHNVVRPRGGPEFELYDHAKDPLDLTNLAEAQPEVVARLAKQIAAWRARAEAEALKPDAESTQSMTPEQLERLRALGYVQ
jgi:arylsulfatase A-like enzyme